MEHSLSGVSEVIRNCNLVPQGYILSKPPSELLSQTDRHSPPSPPPHKMIEEWTLCDTGEEALSQSTFMLHSYST